LSGLGGELSEEAMQDGGKEGGFGDDEIGGEDENATRQKGE